MTDLLHRVELHSHGVSVDRLRECLRYDAQTGELTWIESKKGRDCRPGKVGAAKGVYRLVFVDGRKLLAHRVAWALATGAWPDGVIDHRNGDGSDNRLSNLRDTNMRVNTENQRRARSDSKTGVLGVWMERGRYVTQIKHRGRKIRLGVFDDIDTASAAYLKAKRELHEGCTI